MSVRASSLDDLNLSDDCSVQDADTSSDSGQEHQDGQTRRSPALQGIAKGSTPRGQMNQTERRWACLLDASDAVLWWAYETVRIRYGDGGWHSPDFVLCRLDGSLEVVETKGGYMTDAGRTRFKAAARAFPVARWILVKQDSRQSPWECIYDTSNENAYPHIDE
jgi:hypothetical protein